MSTQHKSNKGPLRNENLLMESRTFVLSEKYMLRNCSERGERKDQILSILRTMLHFPVELFHGYFCHGKCTTIVKTMCFRFEFKKNVQPPKKTNNVWKHDKQVSQKCSKLSNSQKLAIQSIISKILSIGFRRHLTFCNAFGCIWRLTRQGALEADDGRAKSNTKRITKWDYMGGS